MSDAIVVCGAGPFPADEAWALDIVACCKCGRCWWSDIIGAWLVPDNWGLRHRPAHDREETVCECGQDLTRGPGEETDSHE